MLKITILKHLSNIEINCDYNSVLMDVLTAWMQDKAIVSSNGGFIVSNHCGGKGSCKKCLVRLVQGSLPESSKCGEYYLACQARVYEDITIELPNSGNKLNFKELYSFSSPIINSGIEKKLVELPIPSLEDKLNDFERLKQLLPYKVKSPNVLKKLPHYLRKNSWKASIIVDNFVKEIINFADESLFGISVDIGTTTINSVLVNLTNGEVIDSESDYNAQISYGSDVISRIVYSQKPSGIETLHNAVIKNINSLIEAMLKRNNLSNEHIYSAVIAGNTTMIHLFANIPPDFIRLEPYIPVFSDITLQARDINLNINENADVYCFPNVGSYVGGDIISGILACDMWKDDKIKLFIDIGTNGEIALGNDEWILTCACSAGPSFEGAGVKCGTRAVSGAIDKVSINPETLELNFTTINSQPPVGICGSGMIDLIAELFKSGLIDRQGRHSHTDNGWTKIGNKYCYLLAEKENIYITEQDIENIIRTKGAIFSGVITLLKYAGIEIGDIEQVLVAGGIGKSINFQNAVLLGLLPDIEVSKYSFLGNTSLKGAYLRLINRDNQEKIDHIMSFTNYFDISEDPEYLNLFVGSLFIPHTDLSLFPSLQDR